MNINIINAPTILIEEGTKAKQATMLPRKSALMMYMCAIQSQMTGARK
jgi:hypothetical protein